MNTPEQIQGLESNLTQSIQHYQGLLQFLQEMDHELGTADPVALQNFNLTLNELQEHAKHLDRHILTQINTQSLNSETTQDLIEKRALLVSEVLLLNQRITAKAAGVKSLLAHEMGKLRIGQTALSGYRQPQNNRGRITDSTT